MTNTYPIGTVLVATPAVDFDRDFKRSVMLIVEESPFGERSAVNLAGPNVWAGTRSGGPLEGRLAYAIQKGSEEGSQPLGDTGYQVVRLDRDVSGVEERFKQKAAEVSKACYQREPSGDLNLFVGYAGWDSPRQIEFEKAQGAWTVSKVPLAEVLAAPPEERWGVASRTAPLPAAAEPAPPTLPSGYAQCKPKG